MIIYTEFDVGGTITPFFNNGTSLATFAADLAALIATIPAGALLKRVTILQSALPFDMANLNYSAADSIPALTAIVEAMLSGLLSTALVSIP